MVTVLPTLFDIGYQRLNDMEVFCNNSELQAYISISWQLVSGTYQLKHNIDYSLQMKLDHYFRCFIE